MPTRGQVKVWKPKRSDAWRLCDEINNGKCTCRLNGVGPCTSLISPLRVGYIHGVDPLDYERDRMARDARY